MKTHLFVSPHPDDVELGCGALMAKLVDEGEKVCVLLITGGGMLGMVHSGEAVDFHTRLSEQQAALLCLGVKEENLVVCQGFEASRFDENPMSKLVGQLDKHIKDLQPDALYVPLPSFNQDHKYTFEACMAATRPTKADKVSIYAYEQPLQSHDPLTLTHLGSRVYTEVSKDNVQSAIKALNCHKSQMAGRENTLTGSVGLQTLAALRGLEIGSTYAVKLVGIKEVRL